MSLTHTIDETPDLRAAERLRLARRLSGRTLRSVADEAGASESLLSKIENAKAQPSIGTLRRLAATLGRPVAWFFGSEGDGITLVSSATTRATVPRVGPVERVLDHGSLRSAIVHLLEHGRPWTPPDQRGDALAVVSEGSVELLTVAGPLTLAEGDAVTCRGDSPRSFRAVGGAARLLVVDAVTDDATRSSRAG